MRSRTYPQAPHVALLLSLLAVSACARPAPPPATASSVSAADVRALIEPKPAPGPKILTDDAASAAYSINVELWGERLSRAGGRICRALATDGVMHLPFLCPSARTVEP